MRLTVIRVSLGDLFFDLDSVMIGDGRREERRDIK